MLCVLSILGLYAQESFTIEISEPGTLDQSKLPPADIYSFDHVFLKGTFSIEDLKLINESFDGKYIEVLNCKDAYFLAGGAEKHYQYETGVIEDGTFPRFFPIHTTVDVIVMPKTLKKIISYQMPKSMRLVLPEGLELIEGAAFEFDQILQLNIPKTVKNIGYGVLYSCQLKTLYLPDEITMIRDTCIGSVENKLHLPKALKEIRWHGIQYFKGKSITLPEGLERIGPDGFGASSNLEEIHSLAKVPPLCDHQLSEEEAMHNLDEYYPKGMYADQSLNSVDKETCVLYVPKGCVEAYRNATEWSEFKTILEDDENYEEDLTGYDWDLVDSEYSDNASIDTVITDPDASVIGIYGVNGQRLKAPIEGVNIIKYSDGTTVKVIK